MNKTLDAPKTLQEAIAYFSDPERCFAYAVSFRWPDGKVTCPRCESDQHSFVTTRRIWSCKGCKKQFTVKVGTIFEDSPLGMDKWMTAMWLLVNCKNGISSCEVARDLGITQKSAWFMVHRLRLALQEGSFAKLTGEVEVDETYIGGKARNMHLEKRRRKITGSGMMGKVAVMGLLERHGEVRTHIVEDTTQGTLQTVIREHVTSGAELFTDAGGGYRGIDGDAQYIHNVIDHAEAYARGKVHTNGVENFWSLVKRGLKGTYVSVEPFHLFRYLDEQAYRYNNRKDMTDAERFAEAMKHVAGRRVTWNKLTGKDGLPSQLN